MTIGQQIETYRQQESIPVFRMCNILDLDNELEYHKMRHGHIRLSNYQLIQFIITTHHALDL